MKKTIVNVIGYPGSGKSSLCNRLADDYGFRTIRPSDSIRAYAAEHHYPLHSRRDFMALHEHMAIEDPGTFIRPVLESSAERICLDGMRVMSQIACIRRHEPVTIAYLQCPIEKRYQRALDDLSRGGHRAPPTIEAFRADEQTDAPYIDQVIAAADFTIDAAQPYTDVLEKMSRVLTEIGIEIPHGL